MIFDIIINIIVQSMIINSLHFNNQLLFIINNIYILTLIVFVKPWTKRILINTQKTLFNHNFLVNTSYYYIKKKDDNYLLVIILYSQPISFNTLTYIEFELVIFQ